MHENNKKGEKGGAKGLTEKKKHYLCMHETVFITFHCGPDVDRHAGHCHSSIEGNSC